MEETPVLTDVLVIGGGVAGITATLDLAEQGHTVYPVGSTPYIGGKMAQLGCDRFLDAATYIRYEKLMYAAGPTSGKAVGQGITAALEAYGYIRQPYYYKG